MEELVNKMVDQVGIDQATAEKVISFLKDHAADVGNYIGESGLAAKLPGSIGDAVMKLL